MSDKQPTASIVIIGNEILSGRTQDTNVQYITIELGGLGIRLVEVRVVPDVEQDIVFAVNELRKKHDYVFTTGGIGPTHDDITSESVAKAFNVALVQDTEIVRRLNEYYGAQGKVANEMQLRMANVPEGAVLIDNPVTSAPGYHIENVYVLAGFPEIMRGMFEALKPTLHGGTPTLSRSVNFKVSEGEVARDLRILQEEYSDVDIGSYPHIKQEGGFGVNVVIRGDDTNRLDELEKRLVALAEKLTEYS